MECVLRQWKVICVFIMCYFLFNTMNVLFECLDLGCHSFWPTTFWFLFSIDLCANNVCKVYVIQHFTRHLLCTQMKMKVWSQVLWHKIALTLHHLRTWRWENVLFVCTTKTLMTWDLFPVQKAMPIAVDICYSHIHQQKMVNKFVVYSRIRQIEARYVLRR